MSDLFTLTPEQKAAWRQQLQGKPAPAAPAAAKAGAGWSHPWPEERPELALVRRRHRQLWTRTLRPYWLPTWRFLHPDPDEAPRNPPWACNGPPGRQKIQFPGQSRWLCDQVHFCAYCWERRCRWAGLRTALAHVGAENTHKISLSLPGIRTDPDAVLEARSAFTKALRRRGFDRVTLWVHVFGEDPRQGPKAHLDGVVSGADADVDVLDVEHNQSLRRVLQPFHERPDGGYWTPHLHASSVDEKRPRHRAKNLVLAGFYAGRPTFPTRRIWAGLYGSMHDLHVRMTTVTRKRKTPVRDLVVAGRVATDWSAGDLLAATRTAEAWGGLRPTVPRGVRLKPMQLDAVLEETPWRVLYRLERDEDLRGKHLRAGD